ncbi:acetyltransferase (GNAT) family protein [Kribbella amoyensis]|uniref:Acetyltransferase (GNAT) family protein n=1 Tax=Kribbella amoyensis TaxID=996641 RepID=A0A561C0U2_9ACTN|nr:GNAT family N-acetyltransferase [Kribbella amoyensis]TWD84765.1 acetyltransferase (GNAT) family protein [Kribbella amoyensis]
MTETTGSGRAAELLAAYDGQLRGGAEASTVPSSTDGPVIRVEYPQRGFVSYRSLDGVEGDELDALIARQRDFFAERGMSVEWKTRGHDLPADLPERLSAAGFVPEDRETVLVAESADIVQRLQGRESVEGIALRLVTERADFERIAAMESAVWGEDWSWLADDLVRRQETGLTDVYVAEADGQVVSAAWAVYKKDTEFTGLWGGSTLAEWRGRGIYKALVAVRAARAVELGYRYLHVDASDDSSPILQRLGFRAVTTTTPYVFTPAS